MRVQQTMLLLAALWIAAGCGAPAEIEGGTPGLIHVSGVPLADVHVAVFASSGDEAEPLAFGISDRNGRFELRRPGTLEAVWLEPGDYSLTVESTGEFELHWPAELYSRRETPLQVKWSSGNEQLDLNVPEPMAAY